MKHVINTTDLDGNSLRIEIRLNDECKNGHQDFAITADAWQKGKPRNDRNHIYCGRCHEEILAVRPDLKIFVDLHLCDYLGAPMYAVDSGFYHLKDKSVFMDYMRITEDEYKIFALAEDQKHFHYILQISGIVDRWKVEADAAIKLLEDMTGEKFVNTSTKQHFNPLSDEDMTTISQLVADGYYSPENIEARRVAAAEAKKQKQIDGIVEDVRKQVYKAHTEGDLKIAILRAGFPIDNFIYYDHTNEGVFNWRDKYGSSSYYSTMTAEGFGRFILAVDRTQCPKGITFKCDSLFQKF